MAPLTLGSRFRRALVAALACAFVLIGGCPITQSGLQLDPAKPEVPFLSVHRFTYSRPNVSGEYPGGRSGIIAAVWQNGTILRATSEADIGLSYVFGALAEDDLEQLIRKIDESGMASGTERSHQTHAPVHLYNLHVADGILVHHDYIGEPQRYWDITEFLLSVEITTSTKVEGDVFPTSGWFE